MGDSDFKWYSMAQCAMQKMISQASSMRQDAYMS